MNNFVKTSDKDTADKLIKAGFTLVNKDTSVWTFLNNGPMLFSDDEKKKIIYTNALSV